MVCGLGLIGRKIEMTTDFLSSKCGITDVKELVGITSLVVEPNVISMIKTLKKDGYSALQLAFEDCKKKKLSNAELFHLLKKNITPKKFLREVRIKESEIKKYSVGDIIDLSIFMKKKSLNVSGNSKGQGFSGTIKKDGHSRGPMSHGSGYHRGVGSSGSISANRVFKGRKLPGRMGGKKTTIRNLKIHRIILDKNIILLKGSVPGPKKSLIFIYY